MSKLFVNAYYRFISSFQRLQKTGVFTTLFHYMVLDLFLSVANTSFRWRASTQFAALPEDIKSEQNTKLFLNKLKRFTLENVKPWENFRFLFVCFFFAQSCDKSEAATTCYSHVLKYFEAINYYYYIENAKFYPTLAFVSRIYAFFVNF